MARYGMQRQRRMSRPTDTGQPADPNNPNADPNADPSMYSPTQQSGRYNPAAYNSNAGGPKQYNPDLTSGDPYTMYQQDRRGIYDQGNRLDQSLQDTQMQRGQLEAGYRGQADQSYQQLAENPGYTPDEQANILRSGDLQNMAWTPEMSASNYLSPEEQSGMAGNPNFQSQWLNPDFNWQLQSDMQNRQREGMGQLSGDVRGGVSRNQSDVSGGLDTLNTDVRGSLDQGANQTLGAIYGMAGNVRGAIDPSQMRMSDQYGHSVDSDLAGSASGVRGAVNPAKLGLSSEFNQNYNFGPADAQAMVTQAGTTAGTRYAAANDALQRQAVANGNVNPLALQAARSQLQSEGGRASDQAMLGARIGAKELGLNVASGKEGMRLGAEQQLAGLQSSNERYLGSQALAANQAREQMRLGSEAGLEGLQAGTELSMGNTAVNSLQRTGENRTANLQQLGSTGLANRQRANEFGTGALNTLGQTQLGVEGNISNSAQGTERYVTGTGMGSSQWGDTQGTNRAAILGLNRQGTNQYNQGQQYGRQQFDYGAQRSAAEQAAAARMGGQQQYRNYQAGQADTQAQLGQQTAGQRIQNYGTQYGLANQATNNYGQYKGAQGQSSLWGNVKRGIGTGIGTAIGNLTRPKPEQSGGG